MTKRKTPDGTVQDGRIDPVRLDVATKPKRKRRRRNRPEPAAELREWEKAAEKRAYARPFPPGVMFEPLGFDQEAPTPPHSDEGLWWLQLADAFGTRSSAVISSFMDQLEALCEQTQWDEQAKQWRLNENTFSAALAIVNSVKPRNKKEAALAAQMVAIHLLSMKVAARAIKYDCDTRTAATAGKLARTFTLQPETLQKLRGRKQTSRQSITVKNELHQHVHYHPGTRGVADNPMNRQPPLLTSAPLCQARTRRGTLCRCPAVRGKQRCRLHGGAKGSGAPEGERNGMWKHGGFAAEAVALRRAARRLIRALHDTEGN